MATKTNTTAVQTREELAAQIRADLMAALNGPKTGLSLTDRVLKWGADKLSDAGNGIAELGAGASAAVDNFSITYATARLRQQQRTQSKVDALVEARLKLSGL